MNPSSNSLYRISRILIAIIFLVAGTRKLLAFAGTAAYFGKLGLPAAEVVTGLTIALEICGALALIFGYKLKLASILLGLFTIASALLAHQFWVQTDPMQFGNQLNHFLKNVAMAGGFLLIIVVENMKDNSGRG